MNDIHIISTMIPDIAKFNFHVTKNNESHLLTAASGLNVINLWKVSLSDSGLYNKPGGFIRTPIELFDVEFVSDNSLKISTGTKISFKSRLEKYIHDEEFVNSTIEKTLEDKQEIKLEKTNLDFATYEVFDNIQLKLPQILLADPPVMIPTETIDFPIIPESVSEQSSQPRVESVDSVLLQSIKSNNVLMLKKILATTNEDIIKKSIEKLPQNMVLNFLKMALLSYYKDKEISILWIRILLSHHMGYLLTVPGLLDIIAPFFMIVKNQYRHYNDLVKLDNRLGLLVSLGKFSNQYRVTSLKPKNIFRDPDNHLEEMEEVIDDEMEEDGALEE